MTSIPDAAQPATDQQHAVADAVRQLREWGWSVCLIRPGAKQPDYERWPTFSKEPDSFGPGDNVGIITGRLNRDLVCVDLDGRRALKLADRYLPPTGMIDGRPGKPRSHRWYFVTDIPPELVSHGCQVEGGPGTKRFRDPDHRVIVEILGTGAQAVVPPSVWTDESGRTERRAWDCCGTPAVVRCADLYAAVRELAAACGWQERPPPPPRPPAAPRAGLNGSDLTHRAARYLATCEPAVSGQGGHGRLMWAARCVVYGFDLGPEAGYQILRAEYSPRCSPPWSDRELWHKCEDADDTPFDRPRGWLRDAPPPEAPRINFGGSPTPPKADDPADGHAIILRWFKEYYQPVFKRGDNVLYSAAKGCEIKSGAATWGAPRELLDRLANASDAPCDAKGNVKRHALPQFFNSWSRSAWVDLLDGLPSEEDTSTFTDSAEEEFRQLVTSALLSMVSLAEVHRDAKEPYTEVQRRPLIDWCGTFARGGRWEGVRGYRIWCRLADGQFQVALRHELFAQIKADRRLTDMRPKEFARKAAQYGVGCASEDARPQNQRVIVLEQEFLLGLTGDSVHQSPAASP